MQIGLRKLLFFILTFYFLVLQYSGCSFADGKQNQPSASLSTDTIIVRKDMRAKYLHDYLISQDSPLAPYANDFVEQADANHIDWQLLVSISGVESQYGKQIPEGSYNPFGWGIYTNHLTSFTSWEDGIKSVSKSLREDYIDKWNAENVYDIGRLYAADPLWSNKVTNYMNHLEEYTLRNAPKSLSISE